MASDDDDATEPCPATMTSYMKNDDSNTWPTGITSYRERDDDDDIKSWPGSMTFYKWKQMKRT